MTRRMEDTSQKIYDYFQAKPPEEWTDRDHAILDLSNIISPGEAARVSAQHSADHHESLSQEQQVRRGRRIALIAKISSLVRNHHLEDRVEGNKTFVRFNFARTASDTPPVSLRSHETSTNFSPVTEVEVLEVTQAKLQNQFRLYQISRSDVANLFEVTSFVSGNQPFVRVKIADTVFEFTASAADAFCDRVASQLIYARGSLAQQASINPLD